MTLRPALLAALLSISSATGLAAAEPAPVVVLCGDSTMAHHPPAQAVAGWGDHLGAFTAPGVTVVNAARSGASTKTYRAEGLWAKALANKPTWVLIQFGHNDSHGAGKPESTAADGEFRDNLRLMVDEVRAAGARPVLITPVQRRTWAKNGTLSDGLAPYAASTVAVAAEKTVPLVDLHRRSGAEYLAMGKEGTEALNPAPGDRSHFTQAGARLVAEWVVAELPQDYPRASVPAPAAPTTPTAAAPASAGAYKPTGY
jgi:lysophospholipase L1-like esterase